MTIDFQALRLEYSSQVLDVATVDEDPVEQFKLWLQQAITLELKEPNAFTLGTVGLDGAPAARIMLLKGVEQDGFTFFTNYESAKGQQLESSPKAAMVFFWQPLYRQVRVQGTVSKVRRSDSEEYFSSRPRGAQLGAWASAQSSLLSDRNELTVKYEAVEGRFDGREVECPPYWGGFLLEPHYLEFWQGQESRLHDRIAYSRMGRDWKRARLSP